MSELALDQEALRTTVDADLGVISTMEFGEFIQQSGYRFGAESLQPVGEHAVGMKFMLRVAPFIALQVLFNITVMFCAGVFFLLLFTRGSESAYQTAQRLPANILRMCGLMIWMLVRSLIWIPFIGPVLGIYMVPRLSLAPVFLASGEAGVFQSLHLSMRRTSGHWFTVFLRLVLILIVGCIILWPMLVLAVGVSLLSAKLGFMLLLLALMFMIAFLCASLTVLGAMMA